MRWFYVFVALCLVGFGGWKLSRAVGSIRNGSQKTAVEITPVVVREAIHQVVKSVGEVSSSAATEIKSEFTGRIAKLHVEDGNTVERGQLLVELDRSEMESEEQEMLRAMQSTRLRLEKAERDFERSEGLFAKGFVTAKDHEDTRTELALARNQLEIDEARLQTLREKLAKATLHAPHAGMVLDCDLREGQVVSGANSVSEGSLLMHIADVSQLLVKTDINEVDVTQLSRGMPVTLTFDAIPGLEIDGVVERISPSARTIEEIRVFPLEVSCAAGDPRLKPGISANVSFTVASATSTPAVVISAVFSTGDERHVFLRDNGGWKKQPVRVGINDAQYVQILEGLEVGQEIALTRPPEFASEREKRPPPSPSRGGRRGDW